MTRTLYWGSGSPFSFRALIAIKEKKINFESRLLEFSKGHNHHKQNKIHYN